MSTQSKQFLFVFRNPQGLFLDMSPEEMQKVMGRWMAWMTQLKSNGQYLGGHRLEETGKLLAGPRGKTVTDGPFVEAKEVVGGYITVLAKDLGEATEIARDCPGLESNGTVEIRELILIP